MTLQNPQRMKAPQAIDSHAKNAMSQFSENSSRGEEGVTIHNVGMGLDEDGHCKWQLGVWMRVCVVDGKRLSVNFGTVCFESQAQQIEVSSPQNSNFN